MNEIGGRDLLPDEIVVVAFYQWEGLYLNGKKVQDHDLVPDKEKFLANHQPFSYRRDAGDDEWLEDWGDNLPEDLSEVPIVHRGKTVP